MSIERSTYINAYRSLKAVYESNNIEQYCNRLSKIKNDLIVVKTYLLSKYNNSIWDDYVRFEAIYQDICYYASHTEEKLLREANDSSCKVLVEFK